MTFRRTTLSLLACFNLIIWVIYIKPFKITTFSSNPIINETDLFTESSLMTAFMEKTANNESMENLKKSSPTYEIESTFPIFYNFTLNPQDLCTTKTKSKLSLVILVCSAVPNFKQRQTIRDTWGSVVNINASYIRLGFLLGSTHNATLQKQTEEEFSKHGDVIQQNFIDSYQNLTLKSIMLLRWVNQFCVNVQYVLKTDDDMYINVGNLINALIRLPVKSNVMYGVLFKKAKPNRNPTSKWFVPKYQFDGSVFPDYLSGTGYAMSRDVVPKLLDASPVLPFMVMEDVFISGMCAIEARVKRFNIRGFAYWRRLPTGCAFKDVISGHHVSISDMNKIWKELQKKPLICRQSKKKL